MPGKRRRVRRVVRFSVRVKGCSTVFKKGMQFGVLLVQEVVYVATPKEFEHPMFLRQVMEKQDELMGETVGVVVEEA